MSKKKNKPQIKGRHLNIGVLKGKIWAFFKKQKRKAFNPKQVGAHLMVANNQEQIVNALEDLVRQGKLVKDKDFKYTVNPRQLSGKKQEAITVGKVDVTRTGSGYIIAEDTEDDIFVPASRMYSARNGDVVHVRYWWPRGRRKPEGEIVEVIQRAAENFIGKVTLHKNYGWVTTVGLHSLEVMIPAEHLKGAEDGEMVVVRVVSWEDTLDGRPEGMITSRLGGQDSHEIEMKAIILNNGFPLDFSPEVIAEANALPLEISQSEIDQRRDMRAVTTFTIDPATAKDFDDALSFKVLENGNIEIGVHIADVSHYVRSGTLLDQEAFERSTSVYLVDRVNPMLPEVLSNELCSLKPHEDKLTFSAVFEFTPSYKIIGQWFGRTIIHSDRRFTYEEAQEVIEKKDGDYAEELLMLNKIAEKLRKERFKEGSIGFETDEVQFKLDEQGNPIGIYLKERKAAHMLVEDFMLLANKKAALFIAQKEEKFRKNIPFVYRIHDEPDIDRIMDLALFAAGLGFTIDTKSPQTIAKSFNLMVEEGRENVGLKLLEPLAIRTMAKAIYSTKNIGHYGLGFSHYTHFTSPIRRYSDVLVHRLLDKNLSNEVFSAPAGPLEEQCKHISSMERKAMEAERESVKYKQVQYLEQHIGEEFTGFISGITERGFYVELLENRCEGMINVRNLKESIELMDGNLRAIGKTSGTVFQMGDFVKVRLKETNLIKRQIDFELV